MLYEVITRWIGSPEARASVIDRTVRSAPVHEPGEAAVYGDLDFIVLGAIVEAVAGRRLDEFCHERIFGPLEMPDTFFIVITSYSIHYTKLYENEPARAGSRSAT